jgi:hypothetical protein
MIAFDAIAWEKVPQRLNKKNCPGVVAQTSVCDYLSTQHRLKSLPLISFCLAVVRVIK